MFGLLKPATFSDPALGDFIRSGGWWRGTLRLDSGAIPLALAGSRRTPDPAALAAARAVAARLPGWRGAMESALFAHYEPYAEAVAAGEFSQAGQPFPAVASPAGVWPHASFEFVSVSMLDGSLVTELGCSVAWDPEHTLGARFSNDGFIELCGSVLSP